MYPKYALEGGVVYFHYFTSHNAWILNISTHNVTYMAFTDACCNIDVFWGCSNAPFLDTPQGAMKGRSGL